MSMQTINQLLVDAKKVGIDTIFQIGVGYGREIPDLMQALSDAKLTGFEPLPFFRNTGNDVVIQEN